MSSQIASVYVVTLILVFYLASLGLLFAPAYGSIVAQEELATGTNDALDTADRVYVSDDIHVSMHMYGFYVEDGVQIEAFSNPSSVPDGQVYLLVTAGEAQSMNREYEEIISRELKN